MLLAFTPGRIHPAQQRPSSMRSVPQRDNADHCMSAMRNSNSLGIRQFRNVMMTDWRPRGLECGGELEMPALRLRTRKSRNT